MSETATVETILDALCEVAAVLPTEAELQTAQAGIRNAVSEPMAGKTADLLGEYWSGDVREWLGTSS